MKELLGKLLYKIGILVSKIGAHITNAGFAISGISKEKAINILSSAWPNEWTISPPVTKYEELKYRGAFVRSEPEV